MRRATLGVVRCMSGVFNTQRATGLPSQAREDFVAESVF